MGGQGPMGRGGWGAMGRPAEKAKDFSAAFPKIVIKSS